MANSCVKSFCSSLLLTLFWSRFALLSAAGPNSQVLVVGSVNADILVPVDRFPEEGENVVARETEDSGRIVAGGKGANQAVSCARLDVKTSFVCQLSEDPNGCMLRRELEANAVDLSLAQRSTKPSGLGVVFLRPDGSVSAVVVGAANAHWPDLDPEALFAGREVLAVMLQMEVPQRVNAAVARAARARGVPVFQDAGGAETPLADLEEHLANCDYLSPNETELKRLTGMPVDTNEEVVAAARALQARARGGGGGGGCAVLATLGARGSLFVPADPGEEVVFQEALPPPAAAGVVDATGAGDNYRAAFVVARHRDGRSVAESMAFAAACGALAVGRAGALPSLARRAEAERHLASSLLLRVGKGGWGPAGKEKKEADGAEAAEAAEEEEGGEEEGASFPLKFASRLNSFRDREAVLGLPSTGPLGWVRQQGEVPGLDLVDFNYPQHFSSLPGGPALSEEGLAVVRAALAGAGLAAGAVCLRYPAALQAGAFTNPDPEKRALALRLTLEACAWAEALGAGEVTVWSAFDGYDYPLQADYDALWGRVVAAFRAVCDAHPGLKVSLEFKPTDENTRWFAVPSTGAAVLLAQQIDRPNFGLTLDFGHCLMAGENPGQSVALVAQALGADRLYGVQLGDGYGRLGAEDGLLFGSLNPLAAFDFLYQLRRVGFSGHLYFDTFAKNEHPPAEALRNMRTARRLWAAAGRALADPALRGRMAAQDALGVLGALDAHLGGGGSGGGGGGGGAEAAAGPSSS